MSIAKLINNSVVQVIEGAKVASPMKDMVQADLKKICNFIQTSTNEDMYKPSRKEGAFVEKSLRPWSILRNLFEQINSGMRSAQEYASKSEDLEGEDIKKLVQPDIYTYCYLVEIKGLIDTSKFWPDKTFTWMEEPAGNLTSLKRYFNSLELDKASVVRCLTGKVVDLNLAVLPIKGKPSLTYFVVGIKTNPKQFEDVLQAFGAHKANYTRVVESLYHCWLLNRPEPSFFMQKNRMEKAVKPGQYLTPSGSLIYIPNMTAKTYADGKNDISKVLSTPPKKDGTVLPLPMNRIFFPDAESETLICTDNKHGSLQSFSLVGIAKPDARYKLHLLDENVWAMTDRGQGHLAGYLNFTQASEVYDPYLELYNKYRDLKIGEVLDKPEFQKFLNAAIKYGTERYGDIKLFNWMAYMGILFSYKELMKSAPALIRDIEERKRKFNSVTADDAPPIPNMAPLSVRFPHQAEALAKLNIATDSAIVDVATGGGKTPILIQDCINLLNKGFINKPIIVMPNSLVGQFVSQITNFTANQMNGFALTSESEKNWGTKEEFGRAIETAPKNTIFVASFNWLTRGGVIKDYDMEGNIQKTFGTVRWLRQFGIDYIAIDESQNIKHMTSLAYQACAALGRGIPFKRIATGTLISNKPTDLVGQLMFIDPLLIGNKKQFEQKYAIGGKAKNGYHADAAERIRDRLRSGSAYIMYREKDWASLLPTRHFSIHRCSLTPEQAKVYRSMVDQVMQEIKDDPVLAAAWEKMREEGEELENVPSQLLGKLAKLEIFLTAPDSSTLMSFAEVGAVSVKMETIDNLIEKSLKMNVPNNKVIVAVHFKSPAKHLYMNSRFKDVAAYYDASKKDLIEEFQDPNSNLKVMFAVVQSIKEGFNFQVANRIIIADIDWTPGNLKQLEARIFRPHVNPTVDKNGQPLVENLNEGKQVFIDTVIADDSADCVKYALQGYKKVLNSIIMEECPVDTPPRVVVSDEALTAKYTSGIINGPKVTEALNEYNTWNQEEIDAYAARGDLHFRLVTPAPSNIGTEVIPTPWIKGMKLPAGPNEEPLLDYLDQLGMNTDLDDLVDDGDDDNENGPIAPNEDLSNYRNQLIGVKVRTEKGKGRIISVRKKTVIVRLDSGVQLKPLKPAVILHEIGSVAEPIQDTRTITNPDGTTTRVPRTPRATGDDTTSFSAIKDYLASEDVVAQKRRNKLTGQRMIILNYAGNQLPVYVEAFKDMTLGQWKEQVEALKNGTIPVQQPTPNPVTPDETAPQRKKALDQDKPRSPSQKGTGYKAIIAYLKSLGIRPSKMESKSTGERMIVLYYGDKSLIVHVGSYGDLPMDDWKKYADALLKEAGSSSSSGPIEAPKDKALDEPVVTKPKPALNLDDEEDAIDKANKDLEDTGMSGYLDDDEDEGLQVTKTTDTVPSSNMPLDLDDDDDEGEGTNDFTNLDKYLDEDFYQDKNVQDFLDNLEREASDKVPVQITVEDESPSSNSNVTASFDIFPGTFDSHPCFISYGSEEDEAGSSLILEGAFDFSWYPEYWDYTVTSPQLAARVVNDILKKYDIPDENVKVIQNDLNSIKKGKYPIDWLESEKEKFLLLQNKRVPKGTLRLYSVVIGPELHLIAEASKHPGVSLSHYKFDRKPGLYYYLASTLADLKRVYKKIKTEVLVTNVNAIPKMAKDLFKITL